MQTVLNPIAPKPKNADFVKALANGGKVARRFRLCLNDDHDACLSALALMTATRPRFLLAVLVVVVFFACSEGSG